jgi:lactose/cellobiose-specific phosphotransferase system IIC component
MPLKKAGAIERLQQMENLTTVRAVRGGLVSMIPVLTIGAFALILKTFPVAAYQNVIGVLAGGFFLQLFDLVYSATFGVLSVYMTFCISRSYIMLKDDPDVVKLGASLSAMLSFFILSGSYLSGFGTNNMGPKSMFLAIITGLGASALYYRLSRFFRRRYLFTSGADREFNRMLSTMGPIAIVALCFALFNALIMRIFDVDSFHSLLANLFNRLFAVRSSTFLKGFFFVLLSSLLWFFGIHGSDTLEGVMQTYFTPGIAVNQAAVAVGEAPTAVVTKEFFDCFVLMGGCGSAICLLIAILLFSRNRARRGLGLTAAFPMIFNINELMVFGLPIIFNPIMLIPFLAVPLVCYTAAYIAISAGIVPMITGSVEWTTPILLGGFHATGTIAGSLLQLFNVALGVLIYTPFVRLLDRHSEASILRSYNDFIDYFRSHEQDLSNQRLTDLDNVYGDLAKALSAELKSGLDSQVRLAYQPQYHYDGHCIGVEALLRWKHDVYGFLYPPLVMKLADEGNFLADLEESIWVRALAERPAVLRRFGPDSKISINVTGATVVTPRFLQFCRQLNARDPFEGKNLCLEVTEQDALSFNEDTIHALSSLRELGLMLAIDDFSMGQTSIHYLKDNMFDIIKLDGSLVGGLFTHQNSREIISSITRLANSLNLTVLSEFVETAEQRDILHEIGCDCYQGYLYSPAVFVEDVT